MARTSSHFLESLPSFAAASHCLRKNTENVSQSEAVADKMTLLPLLTMDEFFNVIFFLEETEEEEEIIAATGTEFTRAAIIFTEVITKIVFERGSCVFGKSFKIILLCVWDYFNQPACRDFFLRTHSVKISVFPEGCFWTHNEKKKKISLLWRLSSLKKHVALGR